MRTEGGGSKARSQAIKSDVRSNMGYTKVCQRMSKLVVSVKCERQIIQDQSVKSQHKAEMNHRLDCLDRLLPC